MKHDPKQIITPYAFDVHPDLLGMPLATPKRRFAALLCDLVIASILGSLGSLVLAAAVSVLFFWIAIRTAKSAWWKNALRYTAALVGSLLVFALSMGILGSDDGPSNDQLKQLQSKAIVNSTSDIDWDKFEQSVKKAAAQQDITAEDMVEDVMNVLDDPSLLKKSGSPTFLKSLPEEFASNLSALSAAVEQGDSLRADSLRLKLASVIAKPELDYMESELDEIEDKVDDLQDERDELEEKIDNPSIYRSLKAGFEFMGLRLGWFGLYFIISLAFFKGRTPGKKLFSLKVLRLNNEPIGLWYSFERFGGYAAGFATGLLGFFQAYWDANRQGIHDKIAGTVVVDLRTKKMQKTKEIRDELYERENLLSDEEE